MIELSYDRLIWELQELYEEYFFFVENEFWVSYSIVTTGSWRWLAMQALRLAGWF